MTYLLKKVLINIYAKVRNIWLRIIAKIAICIIVYRYFSHARSSLLLTIYDDRLYGYVPIKSIILRSHNAQSNHTKSKMGASKSKRKTGESKSSPERNERLTLLKLMGFPSPIGDSNDKADKLEPD